jgi:putative transcriptional regulator
MMKTKGKFRSSIAEAVHTTASDLHDSGLLSKRDMRYFDRSCLTPVKPLTGRQIALLRRREAASQAIFAHHLGVSTNLISQWERGEKKPQGSALKLLALVEKNGLDWVA